MDLVYAPQVLERVEPTVALDPVCRVNEALGDAEQLVVVVRALLAAVEVLACLLGDSDRPLEHGVEVLEVGDKTRHVYVVPVYSRPAKLSPQPNNKFPGPSGSTTHLALEHKYEAEVGADCVGSPGVILRELGGLVLRDIVIVTTRPCKAGLQWG